MAKKKGKQSTKLKGKGRVLLCAMILTSIAVLPTTVLFFVGMIPTVVARLTDTTKDKSRVLTIGFMNFAGCFPIWIKLLQQGHKFEVAVGLLSDPSNIVIMYAGAFAGYMIEWTLSGIVASFMVQKGRSRLEIIKKVQKELIDKWGPEVTGDIPLDDSGFPLNSKKD